MTAWTWVRHHPLFVATCALLVLLAAKFLYPVFAFDLPLGYDPGMYRYLFLKYAQAFPSLPELRPWAQEYPYGLFILSGPLIKMGVPVDWFLGWIWSAMAVVLIGSLAFVFSRREGKSIGVLVLLLGIISLAFYDGFAAMYWKTFLAMFFLVLTLYAFERRSPWMVLFGILTILTHNQTGLILGLVLLSWWLVHLPTDWKDKAFRRWTIAFAAIAVLGVAWYAPIWFRAFWAPLKSVLLLRGEAAPGGGFPDTTHYLSHGVILFAFGASGWVMSFRKERFSVWQLAVAVCAAFVFLKLVFYRRFFLQLDFFLLPFAAIALYEAWKRGSHLLIRFLIIILIAVQCFLAYPLMIEHRPRLSVQTLASIQSLPEYMEEDAAIIALENQAAAWLIGWLPGYYTGGPGLFDFPPWKYEDWEKFLYGTHDDRLKYLSGLEERPLYFMTSPLFFSYYGDSISSFMADPCFEAVEGAPLLRVVCEPK